MLFVYILGLIVLLFGVSILVGAPFIPTKKRDLARLLDEIDIKNQEVVLDLGSGDGFVLRQVAKRGIRAVGYEIHPVYYVISKLLCRSKNISIKLCNIWTQPFPKETTIVYAFALKRDGKRLERKVQNESNRLNKPLTLICYGSPIDTNKASKSFDAYRLYSFKPLHLKKA